MWNLPSAWWKVAVLARCFWAEDWKVNRQQVKEVEIHDEKGSPVWGEVYLIWTQEAYRDLKIRRFINFTEAHFKSKNPSLGEST